MGTTIIGRRELHNNSLDRQRWVGHPKYQTENLGSVYTGPKTSVFRITDTSLVKDHKAVVWVSVQDVQDFNIAFSGFIRR